MANIRSYRTRAGKLRYQADVQDTLRGVPRTKRSFATRKEAAEWVAAVHTEGQARLIGRRPQRLFGDALARYLREESPHKASHEDDKRNAIALRYPVQHERRWLRLEDTPLEEMVPALAAWTADMRLVTRRRYLGAAYFLQRPGVNGEPTWFEQPSPSDGEQPRPRFEVRDRTLIAELEEPGGRGPYSGDTLRIRQALVRRILRLAWRRWDWLEHDLAGKIECERPGAGREAFLTVEQLQALMHAAAAAVKLDGSPDPVGTHFADAIMGAAFIGWRKQNVLQLEWSRVAFPVYEQDGDHRRLMQAGVIWVDAPQVKNRKPLAQPISERLELLLQRRWACRNGTLVFHRGDGNPFGDFRSRFKTALKKAGLPIDFRWHDLRHTWASHLLQSGVSDRHLQELGGWGDQKMVRRYSHLRVEHLLESVNKPQ